MGNNTWHLYKSRQKWNLPTNHFANNINVIYFVEVKAIRYSTSYDSLWIKGKWEFNVPTPTTHKYIFSLIDWLSRHPWEKGCTSVKMAILTTITSMGMGTGSLALYLSFSSFTINTTTMMIMDITRSHRFVEVIWTKTFSRVCVNDTNDPMVIEQFTFLLSGKWNGYPVCHISFTVDIT